jgi:hypothetical protein
MLCRFSMDICLKKKAGERRKEKREEEGTEKEKERKTERKHMYHPKWRR